VLAEKFAHTRIDFNAGEENEFFMDYPSLDLLCPHPGENPCPNSIFNGPWGLLYL
jgi:hypothetical protein